MWNKASERTLQKSGQTFIRHEPQGFQKRGEWVAENVLEIARADWGSTRPPIQTRNPHPSS